MLAKALAYMMRLGGNGLTRASEYAVLNANYLRKRLEDVLDIPFDRICAHEFVASAPEGLRALDIAKGLLDRGIHAPTIYFPLIVKECLMAEPRRPKARKRWTNTWTLCARSWPKAANILKSWLPRRSPCRYAGWTKRRLPAI